MFTIAAEAQLSEKLRASHFFCNACFPDSHTGQGSLDTRQLNFSDFRETRITSSSYLPSIDTLRREEYRKTNLNGVYLLRQRQP